MNILISACLLGRLCKYDGGTNTIEDEEFIRLIDNFNVIKVCPEVFGGLSVPRPPAERIEDKVINIEGKDVTLNYEKGAAVCLEEAKEHNPFICILKEGSPACGVNLIHDGNFKGNKIKGSGVFCEKLNQNGYLTYSEKQLDEIKKILKEHL